MTSDDVQPTDRRRWMVGQQSLIGCWENGGKGAEAEFVVWMACAGKRGRRGSRGEEDDKNATTNQTSALDGKSAVVGGMVVVAASIGAVLAVVWEEIFGRVGGNRNWPW
jgi:hypothetical protein